MLDFHPFVVHFAVALLIISVLFDVVAVTTHRPHFENVGWWNLFIGFFASVFAVITGLYAKNSANFGTGIEHHLIERVFDPFFSTKPNGEGTGLGLSISYGLIRDNGGYLRIKSLLNSYTTVIIDLPAAAQRGENDD